MQSTFNGGLGGARVEEAWLEEDQLTVREKMAT